MPRNRKSEPDPDTKKPKRPSSPAQQNASRSNGAKSHGPVTPEGKDIAKMNAFKHGFCGDLIMLPGESHSAYNHIFQDYMYRFQPEDHVTFSVVEELTKLHWEMRRGWTDQRNSVIIRIEDQRRVFDREFEEAHPTVRVTRARETELAPGGFGDVLDRHLARLSRTYDRTLRRLKFIRDHFPLPDNRPNDLCERFDRASKPNPPAPPPTQPEPERLNSRNEPGAALTPVKSTAGAKPQPAATPARPLYWPPETFVYADDRPETLETPEINSGERPKTLRAAA